MSFQNEGAFLPSDLLDSDDEVAPQTTKTQNNSFSKLYDDMSEAKTADNSSNGANSSSEMSSIFSVEPFKQCSEDFIVGWKCSVCQNFNTKKRESCNKCEKERVITEDLDVTKRERRSLQKKKTHKVGHVMIQDGKTVGITRGDRVVEFEEYNHALDNRHNKRKQYAN